MEEELRSALVEEDIEFASSALPQLTNLASKYGLNAEDLCLHWLTFTTNHTSFEKVDTSSLQQFELLELRPKAKKHIAPHNSHRTPSSHTPFRIHNQETFNSSVKSRPPTTPIASHRSNKTFSRRTGGTGATGSIAGGTGASTSNFNNNSNNNYDMFGSHGGSTEKSIKSQSRINGRSDTYESYKNKNYSNNNLNTFNNYKRSNSNNNNNSNNQNNGFASKWNAKITTPSKNSSYSSARQGLLSTPMTAPSSRRTSSLFQSPAPGLTQSPAYLERKNRGSTVATLNSHLSLAGSNASNSAVAQAERADLIKILGLFDWKEPELEVDPMDSEMFDLLRNRFNLDLNNFDGRRRYRFMFEDVYTKKQNLQQRMHYMGQQLLVRINANLAKMASNSSNLSNSSNNQNNSQNQNNSSNSSNNAQNGSNASKLDKNGLAPMGEAKSVEQDQIDNNINNNYEVEYLDVDEPCQRESYYFGRMMNDGDNTDANDKLTVGSLVLESVAGRRIKLDISQIRGKKYALFPGQIVALSGINPSGKEIIVSQVFASAPLPKPNDLEQNDMMLQFFDENVQNVQNNQNNGKNDDMMQNNNEEMEDIDVMMNLDREMSGMDAMGAMGSNENKKRPMQIIVAAGPFVPKMTLAFENSPLMDLAKEICKRRCDVCILMGPFVDIQNELIKQNKVNMMFDEVFETLLGEFLDFLERRSAACRICIVPSTRDVFHLTAFPQPRYSIQSVNLINNNYFNNYVEFFTNPAHISINGLTIGLSNVDFLMHCSYLGIDSGGKSSYDRMGVLMSHCIDQQSFYPLEPCEKSVRKDYTHEKYLLMKRTPHVLVLPSQLKYFAKIINENVIGINPSFLTKVNHGGTFALLTVHKPGPDLDYSKCVRVDIVRI